MACIPLMMVRASYSLVYIITGNKTFNVIVGNGVIYLVMTTLPEIAMMVLCSWTLMTFNSLSKKEPS
jgi:hypothetical protein